MQLFLVVLGSVCLSHCPETRLPGRIMSVSTRYYDNSSRLLPARPVLASWLLITPSHQHLALQMGSRCLRGQVTPKMTIKLETENAGMARNHFLQVPPYLVFCMPGELSAHSPFLILAVHVESLILALILALQYSPPFLNVCPFLWLHSLSYPASSHSSS